MLTDGEKLIGPLPDGDMLGLKDDETLRDRPVERETLMLTECEKLEETLVEGDPLGLRDCQILLGDTLVEGERLMLTDCETLKDLFEDCDTL